ncbi:MAG: carbohydrate ABC transporter permease [Saccharofermentanales bacterium]
MKFLRSNMKYKTHQNISGYLFAGPAILFFFVFNLLPVILALYLSFTNYDILSRKDWIWFDNFKRLFQDEIFMLTLKNISLFVVMYVPLMISISLLFAVLLNSKIGGMKFFRTVYYVPGLTSGVAASTVWLWLLNPEYGLVNQILSYFGIVGPAWLSRSETALVSIVGVVLWMGIGGNIVLYLAGLQNIPESLYESAYLDGAGKLKAALYITIPMLKPTTFFVMTMLLIGSFQLFDQAYVLTKGGPANSTLTPVYLIYNNGFNELNMGYASAQALGLFLIIFIFTLLSQKFSKEKYI